MIKNKGIRSKKSEQKHSSTLNNKLETLVKHKHQNHIHLSYNKSLLIDFKQKHQNHIHLPYNKSLLIDFTNCCKSPEL
uniref:Uncharacterized protein n=1 Tax=Rhizophora mucronata TaxID=61149 RepID=A0A2P2P8C1_RHIMU